MSTHALLLSTGLVLLLTAQNTLSLEVLSERIPPSDEVNRLLFKRFANPEPSASAESAATAVSEPSPGIFGHHGGQGFAHPANGLVPSHNLPFGPAAHGAHGIHGFSSHVAPHGQAGLRNHPVPHVGAPVPPVPHPHGALHHGGPPHGRGIVHVSSRGLGYEYNYDIGGPHPRHHGTHLIHKHKLGRHGFPVKSHHDKHKDRYHEDDDEYEIEYYEEDDDKYNDDNYLSSGYGFDRINVHSHGGSHIRGRGLHDALYNSVVTSHPSFGGHGFGGHIGGPGLRLHGGIHPGHHAGNSPGLAGPLGGRPGFIGHGFPRGDIHGGSHHFHGGRPGVSHGGHITHASPQLAHASHGLHNGLIHHGAHATPLRAGFGGGVHPGHHGVAGF